MSEELLVRCCAPTLAGLKTGSLFSCDYATREALWEDVRRMNRELVPRGLRLLPLRVRNGKALLYVFRPACLSRDVTGPDARELLRRAGYRDLDCDACVARLMRRLRDSEDFPHEIGLFLSYPPEDVRGFIENRAKNYKFIGYWKVYGDEKAARETFDRYKKCTDAYCRCLAAGYRLSQLAVAI
jgi:hypothetical protein